jgi:hypothetical protein
MTPEDVFRALEFRRPDGSPVTLGSYHKTEYLLLIFLRHLA